MTSLLPKHPPAVFDADAVLSALPHAVFLLAAHDGYRAVWRNAAACTMGDALQQAMPIPPDTSLHAAAEDCRRHGRDVTLHDHLLLGQPCLTIHLQPHGGDMLLMTAVRPGVLNDTRGQEAEAALRPAALMARVLAHEIKNPLAGIQAAGQLLGKTAPPDSRELTDLIVREAGRIRRLVDQVMVFDADAPAHMQPLNIHLPLEQAIASAGLGGGYALSRHFDPSLPDIDGDHDGLVQVFINLLRNAAEAGARHVKVSTAYDSQPPLDAARQKKLPITVSVEDDGAGMDAVTLSRLFEAYYTTKTAGQGLGLAVVAKIVSAHGGLVTADSKAGRTVFTLSFARSQTV